jgi:hypothetical protein
MKTEIKDLSFKPVVNGSPKKLTQKDIQQYNELGYIHPFKAYDANEIVKVRGYFDKLIDDMGDNGSFGINCYQARLSGIWDIATNPKILDYVEDIIGPNIVCWATAILSKPANNPKYVPWHQDAHFWGLSPARTVTVWLAIDDADEENSAMQWIPRSHNKGRFETEKTGENSAFHIQITGADGLGAPVTDELKAGEFSLHADMIVHGSQPNHSDRRRCGLTLRYCPPSVRIIDNDWEKGVEAILCRGKDSSGHWRHHTRPENNDITKTLSPHQVGYN